MPRCAQWIQFLGLLLGFLGALAVLLAQGTVEPQGKTLLLKYPMLWMAGLILLVVGFFLQGAAFFIPQ